MRLLKLKLSGFKTFVDPTTVVTPGQLVGVVGPNGCGKSNIIDAVRWVLGESKASALRGESMQDVIFNGSTTRKPVSRASVELIFDNAEGRASGQWSRYAEISVKRILDRSGDSTYMINNVVVRRKDVIDLFLGTGLGPKAYAIIEQGMISRIIEARPEEIRGFLEEAAGVTKYKERRKETEGRLSDARDNLLRLDDIRNELESQIVRLASQAEVARRYQELNSELTRKQQLLWLLKREEAHLQRVQHEHAWADTQREIDLGSEQLREVDATLEGLREHHLDAGEAVHRAQSEFYQASAEVTRIETASQHQHQTLERLEQRLQELELEIAQWRARLENASMDGERWLELLENAGMRAEQAQERHQEAQQRLPMFEDEHRQAENTVNQIRRELTQAEQQVRVEDTHRQGAQRALDALTSRRSRLEAERQQIAPPDVSQLDRLEEQLAMQQERGELAQEQIAELQHELPQRQQQLRSAFDQERQAQKKATEIRAKRDALEALQAKMRAQGELGDWMKRQGLQQLTPLWQQLSIEAGWEKAVEALLRERLAALIVEDHALLQRLAGEVSPALLPILAPGISGLSAADSQVGLQILSNGHSFPLISKISCRDAALQAVMQDWLAGVWVVEDVRAHLDERHQLSPQQTLVTREGTCLTRHGITLFAPDARTHGVIERQREIETLTQELEYALEASEQTHERVREMEQQVQQAQDQLNQARRQQQEAQQQTHALQVDVLKLRQAQSRYEERLATFLRDEEDVARQEESERERLLSAELELERQRELAAMQRTRLDGAMDVARAREEALRDIRSLEAALGRELHEAQFSQRECQTRLADLSRNRDLAEEELQRREGEFEQLNAERDTLDLDALFEALQQALEMRSLREQALTQARERLEDVTRQLRAHEEIRQQGEQRLQPLRDRLADLQLKAQAAQLAEEQYLGRLVEAGAKEEELLPLLTPELKELSLARDVGRLGREITELGPVNLAAVEELNTATERKNYLDEQNNDLVLAIETLENAIRRIDRETREQLQMTYETVNREFGDLFPRLFGGGQARLVLMGEDLLDAGLQIIAQPPGKKNASIHLLSGGEKALTAIALVFAMFALNPAPFCMLDEVDAPLDDSNTERFCAMVKRMSAQTQFLFISHSKITMEMASQLVGVTMQEQGVSRIVEVDIEQALQMAEASVS